MDTKNLKENKKCYALYVKLTNTCSSFKIEKVKFLRKLKEKNFNNKTYFAVKRENEEVTYLQIDDIFKTEGEAIKWLVKILNKQVKQ